MANGDEEKAQFPWDRQFWYLVILVTVLGVSAALTASHDADFKEWSVQVLPPVYWPLLVGLAGFLFRRQLMYVLDEIAGKVSQLVKGPQGTEFANLSPVSVPPPVPGATPQEDAKASAGDSSDSGAESTSGQAEPHSETQKR